MSFPVFSCISQLVIVCLDLSLEFNAYQFYWKCLAECWIISYVFDYEIIIQSKQHSNFQWNIVTTISKMDNLTIIVWLTNYLSVENWKFLVGDLWWIGLNRMWVAEAWIKFLTALHFSCIFWASWSTLFHWHSSKN